MYVVMTTPDFDSLFVNEGKKTQPTSFTLSIIAFLGGFVSICWHLASNAWTWLQK
jgi:hypothetical protein